MSDELRFDPLTAREALLAIRGECATIHGDSDPFEVGHVVNLLAGAGLDRTAMINFELSDQLADRLAEAHKLLREVRALVSEDTVESNPLTTRNPMLDVEIDSALALPPDLETMVERRIGHG